MIIDSCASSANLGPGFDCFGIAWKRYDRIGFLPHDGGLNITGCPESFRSEENLAYRAYLAVVRAAGVESTGLDISFLSSDIPISRGLGSSAALIAAGAVAANELHGLGLSRQKLLEIATVIEGHPDNLAPVLLGGMTVSAMDGEKVVSAQYEVSDRLHFAALIPDAELSTSLARSVLPTALSRSDAIFNISRAALTLRAFESGDIELLRFAMRDKLHQPYRTKLIPDFEKANALALENGADALCISGAGSTLLAVSVDPSSAEKLSRAFAQILPNWQVCELTPDTDGTRIADL